MISSAIDTIRKLDREDVTRLLQRVSDELPDFDLPPQAKRAVAIMGASGVTTDAVSDALRSTGRRGRRLARRTGGYVAANPRNVGIGVGGTVVAGVGLYFLYKAFQSLPSEETDPALLPAPEGEDATA